MTQALLLAWASPADDASAEAFEAWYEDVHIPQVREAIPSISSVRRYVLTDPATGPGQRFLAIYAMDDTDIAAAADALSEGVRSGRIEISSAMDFAAAPPVTEWYRRHPA